MLCKLTSLIMAGMMMVTSVPVNVFAEAEGVVEEYAEVLTDENNESYVNSVKMNAAKDYVNQDEVQSEHYEENHIITLSDDEYDNDYYLFQYFNEGVAEKTGSLGPDYYTSNHEYIFGDDAISKRVYNDVKKMAADILAGTKDTTYIEYDLSDADVFDSPIDADKYYTAQELGAASPMTDYDATEAKSFISAFIAANYSIDSSKVFHAARADCPYEFFWSGRSFGYFSGYSYSYGTENGEYKFKINAHEIYYITVSQDYVLSGKGTGDINPSTGNRLTVDSAKISAANSAIDNAADIVNAAATKSDVAKLDYYMTKICDLNDYNHSAAAGEAPYNLSDSYGNPWQLIYVFDGNPSTNVVCEGYSKAFQYLCDSTTFTDSLIRCISVSGYMDGGAHMWNVVRMPDNKNYLVDVTNCDQRTIDHGLFLVPFSSGNVNDGYNISWNGGTLYEYKPETIATNNIADLTLSNTAYVNVPKISVNFAANDGTGDVISKKYEAGSTFDEFPSSVRTGYELDGWYTNATGGTKVLATEVVDGYDGATLYAHWNAKQYTVTFNVNGGNALAVVDATKPVTFDAAYGSMPTPTRTGYDFAGWYTEAIAGTKVEGTTTVNTAGNHTLYAHWNAKQYTVTFDVNGGDALAAGDATKSVTFDAAYGSMPTPTRNGYDFAGWYTSATDGTKVDATTTVSTAGNHTLYAHWGAKQYTVSFDVNGGNALSVTDATKSVTYKDTYGTLPTPTRNGYDFAGWYTSATGGTKVEGTTTVNTAGNHTLYAHWNAKQYTVTFDANGGNALAVADATKSVTFDAAYGSMPTPTKTGYDFVGWYTEAVAGTKVEATAIVNTADNHTLYAHWNARQYTVTFDVNGGNALAVADATKSVTFDDTYGTLPVPTRTGYDFAGWYTEAAAGTKVEATTSVNVADNHTLYAHWTLTYYEVTFDANGGNKVTDVISVTINDTYGTLPTANRTGYTFDGWYTERVGGTKASASSMLPDAADQVLFAHWNANSYRVTFDANGGTSVSGNKIVTFDSPYGELPVASREGYFFRGWFTEAVNGDYINEDSIVKTGRDHVLYAQWDVNKYTVAMPVFSDEAISETEAGRVVLKGSKVSISCETRGAVIYYTTDGTFPNPYGEITLEGPGTHLYEDAIVIDRDMTISAVAVLDGLNSSIRAKQAYILKDESEDWGDIIPEDRVGFASANDVPNELWIRGIVDKDYSGLAITFPEARVYFGKTLLVLNKDYTVKYTNNKNAADEAKATVTVTGKGNYTQSYVTQFKINRLNIRDAQVADIILKYNGKVQKGTTTVTYEMPDGRIIKLKPNVDFTYDYPGTNSKDEGSYNPDAFKKEGSHTVRIIGKGNFGGYEGVTTFTENITGRKLISKVSVKGVATKPYTGVAIEQPEIRIFDGKYELNTEKTDYTIEYRNNVDIGTATIIINGVGDYVGSKTITFKITGSSMKNAVAGSEVTTNVIYDKTEHKPVRGDSSLKYKISRYETVSLRGIEKNDYLTNHAGSRDYDYYYEYVGDLVNAGKVTVIFTGINGYTGTVKKYFKILPKNASELSLEVNDAIYTKGGAKPDVVVKDGETVLELSKDYTVSYSANKQVHNGIDNKPPMAKITGKGNYKGNLSRSFVIRTGSMSNIKIHVNDVIYKEKCGLCKPSIVMYDTDGKALTINKDYTIDVTYTYLRDTEVTQKDIEATVNRQAGDLVDALDIVPVGTEIEANIEVSGRNNYEDTCITSIPFRYVAADISKAKVSVKSQTYTGKKIVPSKDDITVTIGKTVLKKHEYDIVSCTNNVSKGKAQITIKALGNYGGTKTATFNIVSKSLK